MTHTYPDGKIVTIDKEVKETGDEGSTITVENYPIIYEVQLTKVDAENNSKVLEGAILRVSDLRLLSLFNSAIHLQVLVPSKEVFYK